jgi:hypothetical protein
MPRTAASPVLFSPPGADAFGRRPPLGAVSGLDSSTVAPWTPGRLRSLAGGDRRRLAGAIGVGTAIALLVAALLIVARPPAPTGADAATGRGDADPAAPGTTAPTTETAQASDADAGLDGASPTATASAPSSTSGKRPVAPRPTSTKTKKPDPYGHR